MSKSAFEHDEQLDGVLQQVASQLRFSLGGIHSALQRLAPPERRDEDKKLDQYAAVLCQNYYRVLRLANNLADIAELDSLSCIKKNEDIVGFCRDVMQEAAQVAYPLGLEVSFQSEKDMYIIAVDKQRLERLLLNLLSNAFKFTPRGGKVTLEVCVGLKWVELRLSDTGCGIEPERLDTIFDRYRQTKRMEPPPHGLGLGLPVCRRIVQAHEGSITLTSKVGKGTTVLVSLPDKKSRYQQLRSLMIDYAGGYNHALVELADALPWTAFTQRFLD